MRATVSRYACLLAVALSFCATSTAMHASQNGWPQSGHVVFDVLHGENGFKLGESVHRWQQDGQRYSMSTVMQTTGLAAMLQEFQYTQSSEGRIDKHRLRPDSLTIDQRKGRETAAFDWESQQVVITRKQRQRSFAVNIGDVDMLSIWHAAAVGGLAAQTSNFQVVTNRAVYPVSYESVDQTRITLPAGQFDTHHIRFIADAGSLRIDMWLSKAHGLIPVRVLMVDDKGQTLDQRAISVDTR